MLGEKIVAAQTALIGFCSICSVRKTKCFSTDSTAGPTSFKAGPAIAARSRGRSAPCVRPEGRRCTTRSPSRCRSRSPASRRKKALVVISDGNDTSSHIYVGELQQIIRNSEVLVYAIGIDASSGERRQRSTAGDRLEQLSGWIESRQDDSRAVAISRQESDTSAGASRGAAASPAASAAHERPAHPARQFRSRERRSAARDHRRQRRPDRDHFFCARSRSSDGGHRRRAQPSVLPRYSSNAPKDGRWHTIELQIKKGKYTVRARKGFIAS